MDSKGPVDETLNDSELRAAITPLIQRYSELSRSAKVRHLNREELSSIKEKMRGFGFRPSGKSKWIAIDSEMVSLFTLPSFSLFNRPRVSLTVNSLSARSRFSANEIGVVKLVQILVPRGEFTRFFDPMIADREEEIVDLVDTDSQHLARFRIWQLRVDLIILYAAYVSTTLLKRIKTIWTLS